MVETAALGVGRVAMMVARGRVNHPQLRDIMLAAILVWDEMPTEWTNALGARAEALVPAEWVRWDTKLVQPIRPSA